MIRAGFLLLSILSAASASQADSYYVKGAGDVPLATTEAGPANAPGVLFLHGIGHGRESFRQQFNSELAKKFHLLAFDLRGHGMSGKPSDERDYVKTEIWAEDVARVMQAANMNRAIVVAWSYGTLVAMDTIRAKKGQQIAGLVLVGALGGLTQSPPPNAFPADLIEARKLLLIPDVDSQRKASNLIAPYLTNSAASKWWQETTRELNLMVPPYVQPLLRKHPSDNKDLIDRLKMPVLIVHGAKDSGVQQYDVDSLLKQLPNTTASRYDNAGHSPFVEDAARFNTELQKFIELTARTP